LPGWERIGGLLKQISSDGGHALTENLSGQRVLFGVVPVVVMGRPKASNIVSAMFLPDLDILRGILRIRQFTVGNKSPATRFEQLVDPYASGSFFHIANTPA
jgi:hypothetical protein